MMFTGIVAEIGKVSELVSAETGRRLVIEAAGTVAGLSEGDSVAINGACLTVTSTNGSAFSVDAVSETLRRTNLGELKVGDLVNLERPLGVGGLLDGHLMQGHVDDVGRIADIAAEGDAMRLRIEIDPGLLRYVAEKGSVAVDGVSLTVTGVTEAGFEAVLIPHTISQTVLGERRLGDEVNVEVDVIAKYVERLLGTHL